MREKSKISRTGTLAFCISLLLYVGLPPGPPGAAQDKNAEFVIENLQKRYDSTVDFTADFRQETHVKTLNRTVQSTGKLYFKRPAKMLWLYDQPKGQLILADGKNLYYYQPEQAQVLKSTLNHAFRSDVPIAFLLGLGNLKRDFHAVLKGVDQGRYTLQLLPKGELRGVHDFQLGVDGRTFDILWARIQDTVDNITTISFSGMRTGVGLKDSLFHFQRPEGADVVEFGHPPATP